MRDARPSLFILAVLFAVLRSGFRDTAPVDYVSDNIISHK